MRKLLLIILISALPLQNVFADELDPKAMGKEFEQILQKLTNLGALAATEANAQVEKGTVSDSDKAELMLLNKLSQIAIGQDITCLGTESAKCPTASPLLQKKETEPAKSK